MGSGGAAAHRIVPDRIEAGTFLCAVAATGGDVVLRGARADHLAPSSTSWARPARRSRRGPTGSECARRRPQAVSFRTREYPAFPDRHAGPVHGARLHRRGLGQVTETIFENRFMHVNELVRLGANIEIDGNTAVVHGVAGLSGATVMATDLRASASLVIAGLVADGETTIERIYHLDRGYDQMETKLRAIGADIERMR
jgi:UDP-N-acetylglucosamine 1-carboxyvinyltransferase